MIFKLKLVKLLALESIREYFKSIPKNSIMTNRKFWTIIKPFPTNKKAASRQTSIKNREGIINDKVKVAESSSNANMNVGEYTAGKKPLSVLDLVNISFVTLILF